MDLSVVDRVYLNFVPHSKNMVEQYSYSDLENILNTIAYSHGQMVATSASMTLSHWGHNSRVHI